MPVLAYKEGDKVHSVYESLICNEFLEEHLPKEQPLLPEHPVAKAHDRIIIDSFSSKYVPLFYRILLRQVGQAAPMSNLSQLTKISKLHGYMLFFNSSSSLWDCRCASHDLQGLLQTSSQ